MPHDFSPQKLFPYPTVVKLGVLVKLRNASLFSPMNADDKFAQFERYWSSAPRPCALANRSKAANPSKAVNSLLEQGTHRIYDFGAWLVTLQPNDNVYSVLERVWPQGLVLDTLMPQLEVMLPGMTLLPRAQIVGDATFEWKLKQYQAQEVRNALLPLEMGGLQWVDTSGVPYFRRQEMVAAALPSLMRVAQGC